MAQTVNALEGQIERAQPYLERTRRGEGTAELPGGSSSCQASLTADRS